MLTKLLLKLISPKVDIVNQNRYLFISPHPDDIEIGAGATVARLLSEKKEVHFLVCTNGCYGADNLNLSKEEISNIRKLEQENAAKLLGVTSLTHLQFDDGGMYNYEEMVKEIAKVIAKINPSVVFCPDPNLKSECHLDHQKVSMAASSAFLIAGNPLFMRDLDVLATSNPKAIAYYFTDKPNSYVSVKKCHILKQLEALKMHKSQAEIQTGSKTFYDMMKMYFAFRSIRLGTKSLKGRAEGFRVLTAIQMHCYAERL